MDAIKAALDLIGADGSRMTFPNTPEGTMVIDDHTPGSHQRAFWRPADAGQARLLAAKLTEWAAAQDARDVVASATTSADAPSSSPPVAASADGLLRCSMRVDVLGTEGSLVTVHMEGERPDKRGGGVVKMQMSGLAPSEARQLGQHFGKEKAVMVAISIAPAKGAPAK